MAITLRDRAVEMATLGMFGGGTGAAFALLWRTGFEASDIFALTGALIGASGTVAGAVWLADRTASIASIRERELIEQECAPLVSMIDRALAIYHSDGRVSDPFKVAVHSLRDACLEVPALLREANARAATLNFRQRVKVTKAEGAILAFDRFYSDVFGIDPVELWDERSWLGVLDTMSESIKELLVELRR